MAAGQDLAEWLTTIADEAADEALNLDPAALSRTAERME